MASTEAAEKHIAEVRKRKFSIGVGGDPNPLTKDLHHSVHNLSLELYAKDVHFLMELIQNAEDNEYPEGVEPSLEFIVTSKDITETGALMTLLVFNNEVGFSRRNMESICSIGQSTKKGRRHEGFVGEKGIGFKSVFLISKCPYIFSGGYQVRFSDEPNQECGIGYIVPEWVNTKPTVADITCIYGSQKKLPTTTIILPLKPDKVKAVKKQLSEVHPELLLFLSKIKQLSVRELVANSKTEDILSSISISSRHELLCVGDGSTTSYFVQLSAKEEMVKKCWYYMWRQVFPINSKSKVNGRREVNEWAITLAFPFNERLTRRALSAGIFAFLPTEMVTGFPFIIQADFMLASSRETILMDNKWNLGILGHVPSMFVGAFVAYVSKKPLDNLPQMIKLLPLISSTITSLNDVRESIREILKVKPILPHESFSNEITGLCTPVESIRLIPGFRKLLMRAKDEGLSLDHVTPRGIFILHSSIDDTKHDQSLDFLGVKRSVDGREWYTECIHGCNLLNQVSEEVYLDLLCFVKDTMCMFKHPYDRPFDTQLISYIRRMGDPGTNSSTSVNSDTLYYARDFQLHSWLSKCNLQVAHKIRPIFMSNSMHNALSRHERVVEIVQWLNTRGCIEFTSVRLYIENLLRARHNDRKLVISLSRCLYLSFQEKLVCEPDVYHLCSGVLPVIDPLGFVHTHCTKILVPYTGSKWLKLFGSNPFIKQKYAALGHKFYSENRDIGSKCARSENLLCFMIKYMKALDLPELPPPDVELSISKANLTSDQAILLLDWIQNIQSSNISMPVKFVQSIQNGNWIKTNAGFTSPNRSILFDGTREPILIEMTKVFTNFPVIDEQYYNGKISRYSDVLKLIGVRLMSEDSYAALNEQIIKLVSSEMTREITHSLLKYINNSKKHGKLSDDLLEALKEEKWLKTTQGYKSPLGSVLLKSKMDAVAQISNLAVVDEAFYGDDIYNHVPELEFLGVVVDIEDVYKCILATFKFPTNFSEMKKESVFLLLRCIREMGSLHDVLLEKIRTTQWMKTIVGFSCPCESILFDAEWGFMQYVGEIPLIDEAFYGNSIRLFMCELKKIGVALDFDAAQNAIASRLKSALTSSVSPTCEDVISLLNCIKNFAEKMPSVLYVLKNSLESIAFLKTRLGYKSPSTSIQSDSKWGMISQYVDLPLIDDGFYGIGIYDYRDELEKVGAVVNFSQGSKFVANGLQLPKKPENIPPEASLLILESLRNILNDSAEKNLPQPFLDNVNESKWLKTHTGYKTPRECILFNHAWESSLEYPDGPFLDHEFYGTRISFHHEELKAIGVKVEIEEVCTLMYQSLGLHKNYQVIMRIYGFLNKFKWRPLLIEGQSKHQVWIPSGDDTGNWVDSQNCVLRDKRNLFGSGAYRVYALDKYYSTPLLHLFSSAFGVRDSPSIFNYVALWKSWEPKEKYKVTHDECSVVWECIVLNWASNVDFLVKNIAKVPAIASSSKDEICLMMQNEVCIPDDIDLATMFTEASDADEPLFVWYPQRYAYTLKRIYRCLGVKRLSALVKFDSGSFLLDSTFEKQDMKAKIIVEGLLRIVLAFLAAPQVTMPLKERHATAKSLLKLAFYATDEQIIVPYILQFPSGGKRVVAKADRDVYWAKNLHKLFVHRLSFENRRTRVEFISCFAEEICSIISQKVFLLNSDLRKLIQMGFAFGFDTHAVNFLLKKENLQVLAEDEEFISSAFSSEKLGIKSKRASPLSPSTTNRMEKRVKNEEETMASKD